MSSEKIYILPPGLAPCFKWLSLEEILIFETRSMTITGILFLNTGTISPKHRPM